MNKERLFWVGAAFFLLSMLILKHLSYAEMQNAFLVHKNDRIYEVKARNLFIKQEGASEKIISESFFVSHFYFKDNSCIRFVPRKNVYGGSTTYCFTRNSPIQLTEIDRGSE